VKDFGLGQGFVWEQFMKNEEAQKGMMRAGFKEKPAGARQASKKRMSSHSSETRATEN